MTYEVLARKWRPQVFEDVVGQEHITRTLANAVKSGRLAHAYLFSGARGVGKTSVARILAKALNCTDGEPGVPCNRCRPCLEITEGTSVDVQEIDGASNRGIDEIRDLRENIRYMPSSSRYRIYIIDEVHMLTKEAFNALLKTLEEPPGHVKFFFATTEPHKVPITILSRCQRFDFKRIPPALIAEHLKKIAESEGIKISREGLGLIAREAEGGMRDAESLLDQVVSFAGTEVDDHQITDILGIIDRDLVFEIAEALIDGDAETCIRAVERAYSHGYDIKELHRILMRHFRDLLVSVVSSDPSLVDMTESDREELKRQAEKAGREKLQQVMSVLIRREEDLRFSSNPRVVIEALLVKLCRLGEVLAFEEIMEKLASLERRLAQGADEAREALLSGEAEAGGVTAGFDAETPGSEGREGQPLGAEGWDAFLTRLAAKNRAMANVLREWRFVESDHENLKIERGGSYFASSYLDDQERLAKLNEYCEEYFGRPITVKVVGEAKRPSQGESAPKAGGRRQEKKKRTRDLPPPVQEVLQVFQGEVREEIPGPTESSPGAGSGGDTRRETT
ncbi:MAG: DNA polymerase III subunit gamma/tau [Desulfobacteraceae bacterium]